MDLLKTPSVQSLLDSDVESVGSLQYLDIEELDEIEYALPTSEAPSLDEVLSAEDETQKVDDLPHLKELQQQEQEKQPPTSSALQVEFLQAVSQQLTHAQNRSSAGPATALCVGIDGRIAVGTAHGQILSFQDQTLKWVCNSNTDRGAVSCLAFNQDSTRLLAGYGRGLLCQYESIKGLILRRVTLGGEIWGILRVTWAGTSGLALDTGGSVWLVKFSRPLGVRSARTSCLFSGARGEVVAMAARDSRVLALATLSRVVLVAGGHAAGARLAGPPDTLPVLLWCQADERILVCARSTTLQWIAVNITGTAISLRTIQRCELKTSPLWLGWLGGNIAIFDANENLRLWGEDYDKPLDLSHIEPVYASAFFKGLWTDGRVSGAMVSAGAGALGGACGAAGALTLLGRRGVLRVSPRELLQRADADLRAARPLSALRLLCAAAPDLAAANLAHTFLTYFTERPRLLADKKIANLLIQLCVKHDLGDALWNVLWEQCSGENGLVEALGESIVRGELKECPPAPDQSQALIERLADSEPMLLERVLASLPLTALDPHRASVFTRERKLWRGVGAIAATLGGASGAIRTLMRHVEACCAAETCTCAGGALLLAAADALGGRGAGGRPLADHALPGARRDALQALLEESEAGCALAVLLRHDGRACVRLLEQSARDPPFAGPLAKHNRLRVARLLLAAIPQDPDDRIEVIEFISGQLSSGALPNDRELIEGLMQVASQTEGERADRVWLALALRSARADDVLLRAAERPRPRWRIYALLHRATDALQQFFCISQQSNTDLDDLFEFLLTEPDIAGVAAAIRPYLARLLDLRPLDLAALLGDRFPSLIVPALHEASGNRAIEFGASLLETGRLDGEGALAHLRNVCASQPKAVNELLLERPGLVRPEEALAIVQEAGVLDAEPTCLEATGDFERALEALLRLAGETESEAERTQLVRRAAALCTRVARSSPAAVAAAMWARLLRAGGAAEPTVAVEASAHVDSASLVEHTCRSARAAGAVLACAARRRDEWLAAAGGAAREAGAGLARAVRAARRAAAARGACVRCGGALEAGGAVRTGHCARAWHAACGVESACVWCGARIPDEVIVLPTRNIARFTSNLSQDFNLLIVAPPRPDLEGIV